MRPFYLILTTYADGEIGASDPRITLDDAADEFAEVEKLDPIACQVLLINVEAGGVADVTRCIEYRIASRPICARRRNLVTRICDAPADRLAAAETEECEMTLHHRDLRSPKVMAGRPTDQRGFPVPWFVTRKTEGGLWDFVQIDAGRFAEAVRKQVCWVSGAPLGRYRSFVVGPMCVVNRVAGDPPVKHSIAEWSAQICPFLSRPLARRDISIKPEGYQDQRGVMLERNPGVCAIYTVAGSVQPERGLYYLPEPSRVEWWCKGRRATRAEVDVSMETGLRTLATIAAKEGPEAEAELDRYVARAQRWLPSPASS